MAYDAAKHKEVSDLLKKGLPIRKVAAKASCSLHFVNKVMDLLEEAGEDLVQRKRAPKTDQKPDQAQEPKVSSQAVGGHSKPKTRSKTDQKPDQKPRRTTTNPKHILAQALAPPPDPVDPSELVPERLDLEHKTQVAQLRREIMHHAQLRDMNSLKCAQIALESLIKAAEAERKWHQIENGTKKERKPFEKLVVEVMGAPGSGLALDELPNQDPDNWPNPLARAEGESDGDNHQ